MQMQQSILEIERLGFLFFLFFGLSESACICPKSHFGFTEGRVPYNCHLGPVFQGLNRKLGELFG